jgi:hypothetical protein
MVERHHVSPRQVINFPTAETRLYAIVNLASIALLGRGLAVLGGVVLKEALAQRTDRRTSEFSLPLLRRVATPCNLANKLSRFHSRQLSRQCTMLTNGPPS